MISPHWVSFTIGFVCGFLCAFWVLFLVGVERDRRERRRKP